MVATTANPRTSSSSISNPATLTPPLVFPTDYSVTHPPNITFHYLDGKRPLSARANVPVLPVKREREVFGSQVGREVGGNVVANVGTYVGATNGGYTNIERS